MELIYSEVQSVDKKAEILADLIDRRGSRRAFAEEIGIPPTTLQSMLTRGVGRASVDNVIKVCKALGISVEELEQMAAGKKDVFTLAAHHEGEEWTEEEMEEIERFKEFLRMKKKGKNDE
ncbi:helix-turn-helix transcriptional regulator [Brevibacillus choshinensis]|uniref:Helix-turn-helix transcriptional regulator n=1 Tax=Brevibacillus choshinensis TaxID=54911 RepID=A0ABX7FLJ2_BRECH|nr:helix-turn-helix transcriptional regulator [Brevibacillus choshinensis]QRG66956.1 helix-turn-helix transcriptional regulator [Brevibacillus choshinensis]